MQSVQWNGEHVNVVHARGRVCRPAGIKTAEKKLPVHNTNKDALIYYKIETCTYI